MKTALHTTKISMVRLSVILIMLAVGLILSGTSGQAQIYEPEGINMPGAWDAWTNPPANLVLASSTQVPGGKVTKIVTGTPRWQTSFSVAASGGDLIGGSYEWLFTSGSSSNYYQNKWAAVTIVMNSLQLYTKEGGTNNSITLVNGKWYTMNYEDLGYVDTHAIFMETSAQPVDIDTVMVPAQVIENIPAPVTVNLSLSPSAEEIIYIRYTADGWATSVALPVTMTGATGTVSIPGQVGGTVVSCYAFSSTVASASADYDMITIKLNNNSGTNYSYTVSTPPPTITFANLQWPSVGSCSAGQEFMVYGRAEIPGITGQTTPAPGLSAWIGYNTANTDPSTWTDWLVAGFQGPFWIYDEYVANLGGAIVAGGTYYYATRFKYDTNAYVYGGYSSGGGGFWDGVNNVSGVLDVFTGVPEDQGVATTIYPNPTFGELTLELPAAATLLLTSAMGQVMLQKEIPAGTRVIDISSFAKGVYHLQIITGKHTGHHTIIKR